MLCKLCASFKHPRQSGEQAGFRSSSALLIGKSTCESCGRPVEAGAAARVVDKLTLLARFGLTGQKLLARRRA